MRKLAESVYFRAAVERLYEIFGKHNINAKEYAAYLGRDVYNVRRDIQRGKLPGQAYRAGSRFEYTIPIASIARYEISLGNVN